MRTLPFASALALAFALIASSGCKSPDQPPPKSDPQSKPDAPNCPDPKTDPCQDEASYEQCLARHQECPGEVMVLESCPVQYQCPE